MPSLLVDLAQNIVNGIMLGGIYALLAVGLNIIFGVVKVVNFAQGEYMMLAMYASYWLFTLLHIDPLLSIIPVSIIFFVFGWLTFRFPVKNVVGKGDYAQIALTMGLTTFFIGTAQLLWKTDYRGIFVPYSVWGIDLGGIKIGIPQLLALTYSVVSTIILDQFLTKTDTGRAMLAVAQDEIASRIVGINVERIYYLAWSIGILLSSAAAGILVTFLYVHPNVGQQYILYAFVVIVLGGMGSYRGALIGSFILGVVQSLATIYISADLSIAIVYTVFVLLLLFKPSGLFGKRVVRA